MSVYACILYECVCVRILYECACVRILYECVLRCGWFGACIWALWCVFLGEFSCGDGLGGVGAAEFWVRLGRTGPLLQVPLVTAGLLQTLQPPLLIFIQPPPQLRPLPLPLQLPKETHCLIFTQTCLYTCTLPEQAMRYKCTPACSCQYFISQSCGSN